jgi:multisubunit Na+/H+ antiporter MnhG subunit
MVLFLLPFSADITLHLYQKFISLKDTVHIKNTFGILLILLGFFLIFNVVESKFAFIYGDKVTAQVVNIDSVKTKKNDVISYTHYAVLKFRDIHNQTVTLTNRMNTLAELDLKLNDKVDIYYDEQYGFATNNSNIVTTTSIFLLIGTIFLFFGWILVRYKFKA